MKTLTVTDYHRITQAISKGSYSIQAFAEDMLAFQNAFVSCDASTLGNDFIQIDPYKNSLIIWLCSYLAFPTNRILFCDIMARYPDNKGPSLRYKNRFGISAITLALSNTPSTLSLFIKNHIIPYATEEDFSHPTCKSWFMDSVHQKSISSKPSSSSQPSFSHPSLYGTTHAEDLSVTTEQNNRTGHKRKPASPANTHTSMFQTTQTADPASEVIVVKKAKSKPSHSDPHPTTEDSTFVSYMSCALNGRIDGSGLFVNSLCNIKARTEAIKPINVTSKFGDPSSTPARLYVLDRMLKNYLECTVLLRVSDRSDCKKGIYNVCQQYSNGVKPSTADYFGLPKGDATSVNVFFDNKYIDGRASGIWKFFSDTTDVARLADLLNTIDSDECEALKNSEIIQSILEISKSIDLSVKMHRPLAQKRILPMLRSIMSSPASFFDRKTNTIDLSI